MFGNESFKICTEMVTKEIASYRCDHPITVEDLKYPWEGSYDIVEFRIKECSGWKFGIWWDKPNIFSSKIRGSIFAQYEATLDKFRPSRSELREEILIYKTAGKYVIYEILDAIWMINFIINEPALAFCRDYYLWNYNLEYHSREEAEKAFNRWKENSKKRKEVI